MRSSELHSSNIKGDDISNINELLISNNFVWGTDESLFYNYIKLEKKVLRQYQCYMQPTFTNANHTSTR